MKNETPEDQYELLISADNVSDHNYQPTAYEMTVSMVGNVLGSICCCLAYKAVNRGQIGLVTQYGRYIESKDEGLHYVNMITQRMLLVDTKRTTHALTQQTVVTADNLQVRATHTVHFFPNISIIRIHMTLGPY